MPHLAAILAAFLACTIAGHMYAAKLKHRVWGIQLLLEGVQRLQVLLRYSVRPLEQIFSQLCEQNSVEVWAIVSAELKQGKSFKNAWTTSIQRVQKEHSEFSALKTPELTAMEDLAGVLGKNDLSSEQQHLHLAEEMLIICLEDAKKEALEKERIYRSLGLAAGLMSAIILW